MGWTRHSGTVVALALLASVVGHFAVHRHFQRQAQEQRANGDLALDAQLFLDDGPSSIPRYLDEPDFHAPVGKVTPAVQTEPSDEPAKPAVTPQPVPVPSDAAPLAEKDPPKDPPKRDALDSYAVRMVIEEELADSSREERDIWYEELKSLPAGVVRDLLQVRKQLRELPRAFHNLESTTPVPAPRVADLPAEPASQTRRHSLPDWVPAMNALEQACTISRHNLANATTPGFKRLRVTLVDSYGSWQRDADSEQNKTIQVEGCRLAPILLDLKAGKLRQTDRRLDLAIDGDGLFVAIKNDVQVFSRCGAMTLDAQRRLCLAAADGPAVLEPVITVPADAIEVQVSGDGSVRVLRKPGADPDLIGQLHLARFPSSSRLRPIGGTLLSPTEESGEAEVGPALEDGRGAIQQGCLEQSNVDVEEEQAQIEQWQSLLKSFPAVSRPVTAGSHDARSR